MKNQPILNHFETCLLENKDFSFNETSDFILVGIYDNVKNYAIALIEEGYTLSIKNKGFNSEQFLDIKNHLLNLALWDLQVSFKPYLNTGINDTIFIDKTLKAYYCIRDKQWISESLIKE